jgi:hypothetical protein
MALDGPDPKKMFGDMPGWDRKASTSSCLYRCCCAELVKWAHVDKDLCGMFDGDWCGGAVRLIVLANETEASARDVTVKIEDTALRSESVDCVGVEAIVMAGEESHCPEVRW